MVIAAASLDDVVASTAVNGFYIVQVIQVVIDPDRIVIATTLYFVEALTAIYLIQSGIAMDFEGVVTFRFI